MGPGAFDFVYLECPTVLRYDHEARWAVYSKAVQVPRTMLGQDLLGPGMLNRAGVCNHCKRNRETLLANDAGPVSPLGFGWMNSGQVLHLCRTDPRRKRHKQTLANIKEKRGTKVENISVCWHDVSER